MMSHADLLIIALCLDAVFGEPAWLWQKFPHPAILTGRLIEHVENRFNQRTMRQLKGIAFVCFLTFLSIVTGAALTSLGGLAEAILAAILLAHKSLIQHVRDVACDLRRSLAAGKHAVSRIVGRDTQDMDQSAVARAAIESAAENFSDGVVAPAFWFLIAGLPGIFLYKAINTADSMIGHKTPRFQKFGWAVARFDDLLNFIPARLTAGLIILTYRLWSQWNEITTEARQHRSPNAGWPEAALSRALNLALSGPRSYNGKMQDYSYVNPAGRKILTPADIDTTCKALWIIWSVMSGIILILGFIT